MARLQLTGFEWGLIQPLLPDRPRGVARVDYRRVPNGIFRVLRTGSPRRDPPERYGPCTAVYNRFDQGRRGVVAGRASCAGASWPTATTTRAR
jgi:transposase